VAPVKRHRFPLFLYFWRLVLRIRLFDAPNARVVSPPLTASRALGGKSPNIMFDDADSGAVEGAANAIFFNHGQCCVAGSRLFVQEDRFDEVVNGVAEIAKSIKLGPGMESGTQMGPLVSGEQLQRVTGFLESGVTEGATTVTGGGRFGNQGYFVEPTVITNTRPDMKIVREEIFGPVVVAEPFRSLERRLAWMPRAGSCGWPTKRVPGL
jgi:phenylacetaldehyde dehydrogenase